MKNKHKTYEDRLTIEQMLSTRKTFKEIGNALGCDCTSISREIKTHYIIKKSGTVGRSFNNCAKRKECSVRSSCKLNRCSEYDVESCNIFLKAPYVCNGCPNKNSCTLEKRFYDARLAQLEYEENLKESRTGISYDENELEELGRILHPLIVKQNQSIHHAFTNNKDEMICCEKEIYKLINLGAISIKNIDLPRKVRFKARKKEKNKCKVDKACRINRKYEDFLLFVQENPETPIVEMDSVEGIKGGKVLLTIYFRNSSFMLAFIREHNDAKSVIDIFNEIQLKIGLEKFKELFPVILTDNGTEFSNPSKIEFDDFNNQRTKVFYCDPSAPNQKGGCEVNHEFIRRVTPKHSTLDIYNQNDIDIMMSHINSYSREKLNNTKPISLFNLMYGKVNDNNIADIFNITEIASNDVTLSKTIFKK